MKRVLRKQINFEILKVILSTFQTFFVSLKNIKNCIYSKFFSDGDWNVEDAKVFSPVGDGKKIGSTWLRFFRPKWTPSPHWTQKMVFKKIFFLTTIAPWISIIMNFINQINFSKGETAYERTEKSYGDSFNPESGKFPSRVHSYRQQSWASVWRDRCLLVSH